MVISSFILVNKAHIGVLRSQTFCKRCRFLALLKTYTDSEKYIRSILEEKVKLLEVLLGVVHACFQDWIDDTVAAYH
jgi:hypothetical protein